MFPAYRHKYQTQIRRAKQMTGFEENLNHKQ